MVGRGLALRRSGVPVAHGGSCSGGLVRGEQLPRCATGPGLWLLRRAVWRLGPVEGAGIASWNARQMGPRRCHKKPLFSFRSIISSGIQLEQPQGHAAGAERLRLVSGRP